MSVLIESY